jgi:hypothetical protein
MGTLKNVKNVLDFNADPGGHRDSTDAFYSAIRATSPGGRVFVPAGDYLVNIDLAKEPFDSLLVEGEGYKKTVLRGMKASEPIVKGLFAEETRRYKIMFRHLHFSQSPAEGYDPAGSGNHGIDFKYIYELTLDHCYFVNLGGWAVRLENCVGAVLYNCDIWMGAPCWGRGGVLIANQSNAVNILAGYFGAAGHCSEPPIPGLNIVGRLGDINVIGTTFEGWGTGLTLDSSCGDIINVVVGGHFEDNATDVRVGTPAACDDGPYKIIGAKIGGSFSGPASCGEGCSFEVYGILYGVQLDATRVTNRQAVVRLKGAQPFGNLVRVLHHQWPDGTPIPLCESGPLPGGISVEDQGTKSEPFRALKADRPAPSVRYGNHFTMPEDLRDPYTLSGLTDGVDGQEVVIVFGAKSVTVDFGADSRFVGNSGVDWTTAPGDSMRCVYSAASGKWHCVTSKA